MLEFDITINSPDGLHAQACAKLVQLLSPFKSQITLIGKGREINAKSIMGVMLLAAGQGSQLKVHVQGEDQDDAMKILQQYFAGL
jgi:phosphocarrier protein HPr